jgi:hypothetical protein
VRLDLTIAFAHHPTRRIDPDRTVVAADIASTKAYIRRSYGTPSLFIAGTVCLWQPVSTR